MSTKQDYLLAFVLISVIICRFLLLGAYPLFHPSEGRYAEIALEMIDTGNWITPQLAPGKPFWGKPPLSFWLTAAAYKFLGVSDFNARLTSFLLSLITMALTFMLAKNLSGAKSGFYAVLILFTTFLFYNCSGWVLTDPALTATVTLSLTAFPLTLRSSSRTQRFLWSYAFFIGFGLSVLAKGLIGWVLIGAPILLWIALFGQWKTVWRQFPWIKGAILVLAVSVPWHILAETATPGFLNYYFIGEHFHRFLTSHWKGDLYGRAHTYPRGTMLIFSLIDTLPWSILLFAAILWLYKNKAPVFEKIKDPWIAYLLGWFLFPVLFFSIARNIVFTYLMPGLSSFSILTAYVFIAAQKKAAEHPPSSPNQPKFQKPVWFLKQNTLTACSLLTSLCLLFALLLAKPLYKESILQQEIAQHYMDLQLQGLELIYTGKFDYTADFYSLGCSQHIPIDNQWHLRYELYDSDQELFVVKKKDLDQFPPEGFFMTREIDQIGDYVLLLENANDAVNPI